MTTTHELISKTILDQMEDEPTYNQQLMRALKAAVVVMEMPTVSHSHLQRVAGCVRALIQSIEGAP